MMERIHVTWPARNSPVGWLFRSKPPTKVYLLVPFGLTFFCSFRFYKTVGHESVSCEFDLLSVCEIEPRLSSWYSVHKLCGRACVRACVQLIPREGYRGRWLPPMLPESTGRLCKGDLGSQPFCALILYTNSAWMGIQCSDSVCAFAARKTRGTDIPYKIPAHLRHPMASSIDHATHQTRTSKIRPKQASSRSDERSSKTRKRGNTYQVYRWAIYE